MTGTAIADLSHIPVSQGLSATLARASEGARATGAPEVSLEHVLAALCDDADAADVLAACAVEPARLKNDCIRFIVQQSGGTGQPAVGPVTVSPALVRILEAAAAAARGSRKRDINGAIILAAIIGDGRSIAAQILQDYGLTFDGVIKALQAAHVPPPPSAPAPELPPPAEDVLARARERVQSRAAPSLRDMMARPQLAERPAPAPGFPDIVAVPAAPAAAAPWQPAPAVTGAAAMPSAGPVGETPAASAEGHEAAAVVVPAAPEATATAPHPPQQPGPMAEAPAAATVTASRADAGRDGQQPDAFAVPAVPSVEAAAPLSSVEGSAPPAAILEHAAPAMPPAATAPAPQPQPQPQPQPITGPSEPRWSPAGDLLPAPQAPAGAYPSAAPAGPFTGHTPSPSGPPPGMASPPPTFPSSVPAGPAGPSAQAGPPAPMAPPQPPRAFPEAVPAMAPPAPPLPGAPGPGSYAPTAPAPPLPGFPPAGAMAAPRPPLSPQPPPMAQHGGAPQAGPPHPGQMPFGFEPARAGPRPPPIPPPMPATRAAPSPAPVNPFGFPPSVSAPPPPPPAAPAPRSAAVPPPRREALAEAELGQLAENIPRTMRAGVTERVEIRLARAHVEDLTSGLDGGGMAWRHDVAVTKAMSVRLRAPEGGFFIETASPETQWIDNQFLDAGEDYASWRFLITPQARGWSELQIIVSARTIGSDGLAAETAFPDQTVEIKVRTNYARAARRGLGWAAAAIAGGAIAKFGEGAFDAGSTLVAKLLG